MIQRIKFWAMAMAPVAIVLAAALHFALFLTTPVSPEEELLYTVSPGSSLSNIAAGLEDRGVIANDGYFIALARLKQSAARIQAGEYLFGERPATPTTVLDRLVTGDVRLERLTIPEGFALTEIADLVEARELGSAGRLLDLAHDSDFIESLGLEVDSLEGYLFPETYTFARGTTEKQLLRAMVGQMKRHMTTELLSKGEALDLDRHELLTLASIIQKEAGTDEEMPRISSVFHNRLERGMRLQADPTVIYGVEDFDGNLTRRHLEDITPYNTYRLSGLPPGPIASPGDEALQAAANPADTDALYFVSRGDGSHVFSRTLGEHNRAVRRYQLGR